MVKTYDRRLIFLGAWLAIFLLAGNATFSVLSPNIAAERQWELSDITMVYPLYILLFSAMGIFSGRYADKHGCSAVLCLCAPLCGAGWILAGKAPTIPLFYLSFGVLAGMGAGGMYNALLTSTLKWFPDRRGTASGILLSAASLGPFVMAPILNGGYRAIGTESTLTYLGLLIAVVPLLFAPIEVRPPEGYRPEGWVPPPAPSGLPPASAARNCSPLEMLRSPTFYKLLFVFTMVAVAGNMMSGVLYTIAQVQAKMTAEAAAWTVSLSTIANFGGRVSFGPIYDRVGGFKSLALSLGLTACALFLISLAGGEGILLFQASVAVLGFAFGGPMVVFPPLTARFFGVKHLGVNYGIVFFGYSLAAFVGPKIALYFYGATGTFVHAYYVSIALALAGIAAVPFLAASARRKNASEKTD